jgi:hypothetical protein
MDFKLYELYELITGYVCGTGATVPVPRLQRN